MIFETDSIQALKIFSENPHKFNLVITDQAMPGLTGLELTRELRSLNPKIPIIICSGYSKDINDDNYQKLGLNGFIDKPFKKSEIAEMIKSVLK